MQKIIRKLKMWTGKVVRIFLRTIFEFDKWHIYTLTEKEYAKDIISACNQHSIRNSFVEIGCGLGDIVRHVRYNKRFGYDMDERALKAARFLNRITFGRHIQFSVFNFPDSILPGKHDAILLVNWIHHIEPSVLKSKIENYFNHSLSETGFVVIDTVQDPAYKFNHDIHFLTRDIKTNVVRLGGYERQREIWLIKK